ncbi:MAG: hypothetical protein WB763_19095 [Terriglobia bacterium]
MIDAALLARGLFGSTNLSTVKHTANVKRVSKIWRYEGLKFLVRLVRPSSCSPPETSRDSMDVCIDGKDRSPHCVHHYTFRDFVRNSRQRDEIFVCAVFANIS